MSNLSKAQALAIWKAIKVINRNLAYTEEGGHFNVYDMEEILDRLTSAFPDIEGKKKADL
jgi:hypothetical protein